MDNNLVVGFDPCEKYEFVNWDNDIPNISGQIIKHVPNHQPAKVHPSKYHLVIQHKLLKIAIYSEFSR